MSEQKIEEVSATLEEQLEEVAYNQTGTLKHRLKRTRTYEKLFKWQNNIKRYVPSYFDGMRHHRIFDDVRTYCLFIGHARSGHSFFGAMLDAHPNMVVADEVDTLSYLESGYGRDQIYSLIMSSSSELARRHRDKDGRDGSTYSYYIPNQWQGSYESLEVIGDTKAGKSTYRIDRNPALLNKLRSSIENANLKVIHIIRNPFDNISTSMLRSGRTFGNSIDLYFDRCRALAAIRERLSKGELLTLRQEEIIANPKLILENTCQFLNVDIIPEYLDDCVNVVYQSPKKTRSKIQWSKELIDLVQNKIEGFDFLAGYSFDA
jgi:hypothetical protein